MAGSSEKLRRIGALEIAEAISAKIGSYVDMNFVQFLAVEERRVRCWYMNSGGGGPTFEITLTFDGDGWSMDLAEHPPGVEQEIEVP
ncbi:hypothetical protein GCM10008170_21560 [Methylopila capsulata]|nr:hypothetical protein GCM10008170_21560 [Methylopila capsulata]